MCANDAWARKNAPDKLTPMTLFHSSSVILATVLSIVIPALLIKMSSRPCISMTSWMVRLPVLSASHITVMNAHIGAVTGLGQLGEELLRVFTIAAITRRHRSALTDQTLTDRRTNPAGTTRHERHPAAQLISPPSPPTGTHQSPQPQNSPS